MPKTKRRFAESDLPYLVRPDDLRALGINPDPYLRCGDSQQGGWSAYMLDREKDAALIQRLQAKHSPHGTMQ